MERLRTISDINIFIDSLLYKSASGQLPENIKLTVSLNQQEFAEVNKEYAELFPYATKLALLHSGCFVYSFMGVKVTIKQEKT